MYNHLSSVNYGDGETQGYTFDAMGNRASKTDNVTGNEGYICDSANRLISRTVGGTTNTYNNDADGNTLNGGGRICTWDSQNRMVSCSYNGNTSSYIYGSDGIRRQATVNGVTTNFVTDNSMFIREMRTNSQTQQLYNVATYLVGSRGPEYRRDDVAQTVRWYVYDGMGSVLGEVDPNGNVTASRKYDVYGSVRSSTGTSTSKHKFVGKLGHTSEDESGLVYMRARYMDPLIGRFVREDPGKDGQNWFVYANNNPTNNLDVTGKETLVEINFTITINGEEFSANVTVDLSVRAVVGGLKQMFTSQSGERLAMFMFRRGLGATDSAIGMMIKLLNDDGSTDEVWHAVVDLGGDVIHQHIH